MTRAIVLRNPFAPIPAPRAECRATVVIPARNEADGIGQTLAALIAQRDLDGRPLDPRSFDVLVYANNCTDATAGIVRSIARRHPEHAIYVAVQSLPAKVAHIGTARRAAMNAAAARFAGAGGDPILCATDADTTAAPTWLAWILREMQTADVVTGRILIEPHGWAALPSHTQRMLHQENAYQFALAQLSTLLDPKPHDPWPRHWQRSGPSLAVRVAAYNAVGGVPPVRALEDIALYDALAAHGARIRHSLRVRVTTSARFGFRAPGGFGARISEWSSLSAPDLPLLVEHPDSTWERLLGGACERRAPVPAAEATAALRTLIAHGRRRLDVLPAAEEVDDAISA